MMLPEDPPAALNGMSMFRVGRFLYVPVDRNLQPANARDVIPQEPPFEHVRRVGLHVHQQGSKTIFLDVHPPIRSLPRQRRRECAVTTFDVRPGADHGIGERDRGRFRPRAMLAFHGDIPGKVRRAGGGIVHSDPAAEFLGHDGQSGQRVGTPLDILPVRVVHRKDVVRGKRLDLVDMNRFIAIQEKLRGDFLHLEILHRVLHDFRVHEQSAQQRHVVRIDEPFGAQGLAIVHQQLHGLPDRFPLVPVQHRFFIVGQFHDISFGSRLRRVNRSSVRGCFSPVRSPGGRSFCRPAGRRLPPRRPPPPVRLSPRRSPAPSEGTLR